MNGMRKIPVTLTMLVAALAAFASRAEAGKTYSCRSDKVVDAPIQFLIETQSASRIHLSAYGGSDKSTVIYPLGWTLYNAAGTQVDNFPKATPVWTSSNMLKETNLEGLVPGATYSVALSSEDWCGNVAVVKKSVTMPLATGDANAPVLSAPSTVQSGLMGYLFTQITFDVTDETGLQNVSVSIDGNVVQTYTYENGVNFRWWFDNYPFDNTLSALEGPCYYVNIPDAYKGQSHLVEVVAVDIYGHRTVTSAVLGL